MLPLCSATPTCSSHSQTSFHGGGGGGLLRPSSSFHKEFETRCLMEYHVFGSPSTGVHFQRDFVSTNAAKSVSLNLVTEHSCSNASDQLKCNYSSLWKSSTADLYHNSPVGNSLELKYIQNSDLSPTDIGIVDYAGLLDANEKALSASVEPEAVLPIDLAPEPLLSGLPTASLDVKGFEEFANEVGQTFSESINKGENALKTSLESINSSISSLIRSASDAVDGAVGKAFSSFDQTGELAGGKLTNFSSGLKETTGSAAVVAVDVLRRTIVAVENALASGTSFALYSYQSVKESFPPEVRNALDLSEERATQIITPAKIAFQKVYIAMEGIEKGLGFDPNDPIVPFVLLAGTSATL